MTKKQQRNPDRNIEIARVKSEMMQLFKEHEITVAEALLIFEEIKIQAITGALAASAQRRNETELAKMYG